jgi:hypothetical protein
MVARGALAGCARFPSGEAESAVGTGEGGVSAGPSPGVRFNTNQTCFVARVYCTPQDEAICADR